MDTKKRVSLYFNLENEDEKLMFEYLDKRNKSHYIKNLILNDIKGNNAYRQPIEPKEDTLDDVDFSDCGVDFDD